ETLWSIGQRDEMSIEFAPGAREQLNFMVGQSVVSRDFPGHQNGAHGTRNNPYTIVFDLTNAPSGNYELALDLIFRAGEPSEMKVNVNGRQGIFPVRLSAYKNNASKKEGN